MDYWQQRQGVKPWNEKSNIENGAEGSGSVSNPLILHIPHSSTFIPAEVRRTFLLPDAELAAEELRLVDRYTAELYSGFQSPSVIPLVFPVCRLVVDPERFPDDADEPMARHGQGAVYDKTQDGMALRSPLAPGERERLLDLYYHPHHRRLFDLTTERLTTDGRCLIVDCHSFPHEPFPFEEHQDRPRPDICIGADEWHTPARLTETLIGFFRKAGLTTAVNHPFAGALVPLLCYRKERRVSAVMIELNRRLYMDEKTGAKNAGFTRLRDLVTAALSLLAEWSAD
jgi:N-formylglutamate deformylase